MFVGNNFGIRQGEGTIVILVLSCTVAVKSPAKISTGALVFIGIEFGMFCRQKIITGVCLTADS